DSYQQAPSPISSPVRVSATPTSSQTIDGLSAPPSSPDALSLTNDVMALLDRHDVALPEDATGELTLLLNKHDKKMQGIQRGREISWLALKKKDDQISSLEERNRRLESDAKMNRAMIGVLAKHHIDPDA